METFNTTSYELYMCCCRDPSRNFVLTTRKEAHGVGECGKVSQGAMI